MLRINAEDESVTDESTFSLVYRLCVKVPRGAVAAKGTGVQRGRSRGGRDSACIAYSGRGQAPFYKAEGMQFARSVAFDI